MPTIRVEAAGQIDAPPDRVYRIIADYRHGHPRIVPAAYFQNLEVERGGIGAGTLIRFQMRLLGTTQQIRAEITEPEPGRVLVETNLGFPSQTTFTVEPADKQSQSRVTIATEWTAGGIQGFVQRLLLPRLLRRIYVAELQQLQQVAADDSIQVS